MRRLALALVLCGCAAAPELPQAPIPLRNPAAPVASQADVTQGRLGGDWVVVQGAGLTPGARLRFSDGAMSLDGVNMPLAETGPGRYAVGGQT
ncbi:lipocalin, partial [Salipiger sp. HF18]|nr:lipocalin [Salipiger sp. HF18]